MVSMIRPTVSKNLIERVIVRFFPHKCAISHAYVPAILNITVIKPSKSYCKTNYTHNKNNASRMFKTKNKTR